MISFLVTMWFLSAILNFGITTYNVSKIIENNHKNEIVLPLPLILIGWLAVLLLQALIHYLAVLYVTGL